MSFGDHIAAQFPGVKWTGFSHIHRSKQGQVGMPMPTKPGMDALMAQLHNGAIGLALWDYLQKMFHDMDWQVSAEEFRAIVLVDVFRHLNQQGDVKEATKIRNPVTGNVFWRLATRGDIVGGVRLWHEHELTFGFRFRLAGMDNEDKKNVPLIARHKALTSVKMTEDIVQKFQIPEPSIEEVKKLRESVHVK